MSESNANDMGAGQSAPLPTSDDVTNLLQKPKPIKEFFKATGTTSKREPTEDQKDWLEIL